AQEDAPERSHRYAPPRPGEHGGGDHRKPRKARVMATTVTAQIAAKAGARGSRMARTAHAAATAQTTCQDPSRTARARATRHGRVSRGQPTPPSTSALRRGATRCPAGSHPG